MKGDHILVNDKVLQREEKGRAEQVKLLFRLLPPSIVINYITIAIFIILFKKETGNSALFTIVTLLSISSAVPCWLYQSFKCHELNNKKIIQLCRYYAVNLFFTALLWSLLLHWVYDPKVPQNTYFIIFSCAAFLIGAAPILSNYFPSYLAYAPTFSVPLIVTWITSETTQYQVIGGLMFVFLIHMLIFSYWLNKTWRSSINLQFENLDLVELLQVQKNAADQANMAKSKFLAAASHDLRQPLHALSLFTAVLNESVEQPNLRKVVEQITMSVTTLESLFNALLDISKLEAGVLKPEKTSCNLQLLFAKLVNEYEPQACEKGLEFICPYCPYTLFTDINLLEQILRNYISNAIRYTNTGRIEIHCNEEDCGEEAPASIKINITDTGVGISNHEQNAIFDEFYQLANPERERNKGLGLGLAIVQRTANLLRHPITVQSRLGEGSTFSITVTQAKVNTMQGIMSPTILNINNSPIYLAEPVILVIDDEASVRQGTYELLELWGCKVLTASDHLEALNKLKQKKQIPDGIIVDYRLREQQTGVDAIYAIHTVYNKEIPALIITGDIATENLQNVNKSGFQVLHKPVATLKLRTFVDHIRMQKEK